MTLLIFKTVCYFVLKTTICVSWLNLYLTSSSQIMFTLYHNIIIHVLEYHNINMYLDLFFACYGAFPSLDAINNAIDVIVILVSFYCYSINFKKNMGRGEVFEHKVLIEKSKLLKAKKDLMSQVT